MHSANPIDALHDMTQARSTRVIRKRIAFQLAIATLAALGAAYGLESYIASKERIGRALHDIEQRVDGLQSNIIQALAREDREAISAAVQSLSAAPGVTSVTIAARLPGSPLVDRQGTSSDQNQHCDEKITRDYTGLVYEGRKISAGILRVCFSSDMLQATDLREAAWLRALRIMGYASFIAALFFWIVRRNLARPFAASLSTITEINPRAATRLGGAVTVEDAEEQDRLAQALNANLKCRALQLVAQGVAHDMNNVLGVGLGYAELLRLHPDNSANVVEKSTSIINAVKNASKIVGRLSFFETPTLESKRILDADAVLNTFEVFSETVFPPDLKVRFSNEARNKLYVDSFGLEVVVMNLLLDASRELADRDGRSIAISIRDEVRNDRQFVCIEIDDNRRATSTDADLQSSGALNAGRSNANKFGLSKVEDFATRMGGYFEIELRTGYGRTSRLLIPAEEVETLQESQLMQCL